MASFDPEARRGVCMRVAQMRAGGIPDTMIALELGVTVEKLQRDCPQDDSDPLGLHPPYPLPTPHRPRGHVGDPFANLPPPVPPVPPSEGGPLYPHDDFEPLPDDGSGFAILLLLMLLGS